MKLQRGFTLIELIMVIVILGILAATAIPKFLDVSGSARQATVQGIAGALGSSSAINFAARSANPAAGVSISNCTNVANTLEGGLPAGYTIASAGIANSASVTCTVSDNQTPANTATFIGLGIN